MSELIVKSIIPVTIRRLTTKDGKGALAKHFYVGQVVLVDTNSLKNVKITNENFRDFETITIDVVDSNGQPLRTDKGESISWIYYECLKLD